jgi:4-hydroxy-tetrahydrodipicolinate reductase
MSNRESERGSAPGAHGRVRILVVGAAGRMGARVCALAHADERYELAAALEAGASPALGRPCAPPSARGAAPLVQPTPENPGFLHADAVIDVSSASGAAASIAVAKAARGALLVGTTGLPADARAALERAAAEIPVLLAPNTSLGVAALGRLVRDAAAMLGPGYECSIVEAHHNQKKDAPSGTALRLAERAIEGGAALRPDQVVSIRGGDVIGEHTVRFAGSGEYIELVHRATSRDLFARGALVAAAWLKGRPAGWYTMEDVLGLGAR